MKYNQLNHKILVVDNEPLVVEELTEFLVSQGFLCVEAIGSRQALMQFKINPEVAIVLSDFRMPEINGVQLVEALRVAAGTDRIFETIMFTGDAGKDDVIAALRAGVADYYQKPLDLKLLLEGIHRVIAKIDRRSAESKIRTLSHSLKILTNSLSEICGDSDLLPESVLSPADVAEPPASTSTNHAFPEKLSPRQKDVAMLIAKGLTNYQIACDLGISENTVKIYVSQILRIFNLRNRTQLALVLDSGRGALIPVPRAG